MKRKTSILALVVAIVFTLGMFSSVFAATAPRSSQDGNELKVEKATMDYMKQAEEGKYKTVSTTTVKKWVDNGDKMVIIDTMPADFYAGQHEPGAINVTFPMTQKEVTKDMQKDLIKAVGKDKNKKIVVYCGFVECPRSHYAAKYLVKKGYKTVYRQAGGIGAWMDAGYETEASPAA